jgi:catechol 2,3-dioxygenase-like lactoylglutathione lyase family enzyme
MSALTDARVEATIPAAALDVAREFYEGVLGLRRAGEHTPGADVLYDCGGDTTLMVYERIASGLAAEHTVAHFVVDDVEAAVRDLQGRGVEFEAYDLPGLKTVNGVATIGDDRKIAWFRDPDDNIVGIHN